MTTARPPAALPPVAMAAPDATPSAMSFPAPTWAQTERLLVAAYAVAAIVTERQPDYFRHRPLRVPAPLPDGTAAAFGLPLRSVAADCDLDPVERLVARRWDRDEPADASLPGAITSGTDRLDRSGSPGRPGSSAGPTRWDGPAYLEAVRSLRQRLDDDLAALEARGAAVFGPASLRTLTSGGAVVTYFDSAGSRPSDGPEPADCLPLVVLNAVGQGVGYWRRLGAALHPRRVLIWQARGLIDGPGGGPGCDPAEGAAPVVGRVAGLGDHVEDVAALLRHEGIRRAHLVGWCTGARVAASFARLQPDRVASLTFLNASFRDGRGSGELDTDYERQLDDLRRLAAERPARVPRVLHVLRAGMFDEFRELTGPDDERAEEVLSLSPPSLDDERRRPFADVVSLTAYCRQLDDYWKAAEPRDGRDGGRGGGGPEYSGGDGSSFAGPTLFVIGSADDVVSRAAQRAAASTFPQATVVEIPAGTHYLMHDRGREVARLVETFIAPVDEPIHNGRMSPMATRR